ncbi:MAG: EFR1 family ferrodoxin [Clostridiaceae bacterium]|nr:EFR1 family ferrodoxin [Clostridiaceae bacterium]
MIVYFTGTGNSRYCAQMLADKLQDESISAFHFIRDGIAAELTSVRPWIFVAPTYGWQLPHVFADFIRRASFGGSREAYFIMTCGSEIGNAASANQMLCKEKGFSYKGTQGVIMPENYIALFDAPQQNEVQKIISAARPALEMNISRIREGRDFSALKVGLIDKMRSGIVNAVFYRFIIKAKPFVVSDACVGCGKCANGCVLSNIKMEDGKPVWGDHCTHCMACICGCPTSAIEYGKASRGQPRYQCPKYEG